MKLNKKIKRCNKTRVDVELFACDNPNADERNLLFSLISIKFVPCEVQRLTLA